MSEDKFRHKALVLFVFLDWYPTAVVPYLDETLLLIDFNLDDTRLFVPLNVVSSIN
jgi:hypothetical protein